MASYFFLRGQEKVTKKKATPLHRPSGSRIEANGRALHQLALTDCTKRSLSRSSNTVPLFSPSVHFDSATQQGEPGDQSTGSQILYCSKKESMVHPLGSLLVAEKRSHTGRKGAACLSSAARGVLCPVSGRVAAPPRVASIAGKPKADIVGVAFSLVSFFWRSKRKILAIRRKARSISTTNRPESTKRITPMR